MDDTTLQIFLVFVIPWLGYPMSMLIAYLRRDQWRSRHFIQENTRNQITSKSKNHIVPSQGLAPLPTSASEWYQEQFQVPLEKRRVKW